MPYRGHGMFEDNVVVALSPERTHRGISGSILRLNDGSLLFVHAIETNPLKGECWLQAHRSEDDGRTWGEPFSPLPWERNFETIAPTLLRLDNGEVLLFYTLEVLSARPRRWGDHTPTLDQHAYVRRSSDDAATWSSPVCAAHYPASCQSQADKVIRLSSGRIIIPCAGFWLTGGDHCVSLCFFSDDGGYSWWPSRNFVDLGSATEEPSVVELEDGRLFMVCRTRRGYLARSHSQDDGLTWSDPELIPELTDPCAGFLATRIPATGDLLVIHCNNPLAPAFCRGEKQQVVRVGELEIALARYARPSPRPFPRTGAGPGAGFAA